MACTATASAVWIAPSTVPGGNPVTASAGAIPRSPVIVVGPVLVTAGVPAKTANDPAVPSPRVGGPAAIAIAPVARRLIARETPAPADRNSLTARVWVAMCRAVL